MYESPITLMQKQIAQELSAESVSHPAHYNVVGGRSDEAD